MSRIEKIIRENSAMSYELPSCRRHCSLRAIIVSLSKLIVYQTDIGVMMSLSVIYDMIPKAPY